MAVPEIPTGLPDLSEFCIPLPAAIEMCIPMAGGITICAQDGFDLGDPSDLTRSLFAQLNSVLAPMTPFFHMIDVIKAVIDCVQAIPDALGPPPDPSAIIACIPGLLEKLQKLLETLPPVWVPKMVKAALDVLITALLGLRSDIAALVAEQAAIIDAATKAATVGNLEWEIACDCAQDDLNVFLNNKNSSLAPLSRLLGVINLFLELAGLPCIPALGGFLTEATEEVLAALDAVIQGLETVKQAIPALEFELGPPPGPDDPC